MVDSFMPTVLNKCLASRTVPALQFLINHGQYRPDCVTVFPTMTASVDSSLMTGTYPDEHKVPSLIWYNPDEEEMVNYINGVKCVWKLGLQKCSRDVLINLNEKHLSQDVTTIFEELDKKGLTSASINLIIHRGSKRHNLQLPLPIEWASHIKQDQTISGPDILTLGAMVYPSFLKDKIGDFSIDPTNLYGINDDFAISVTIELIKEGKQPHFTMIYLPDNDHEVHKVSPKEGELPLIKVDQQIQRLLNSFESWDKALEENIFIVTGDHGQTMVGKDKEYFNINLDDLLSDYRVFQLGEKIKEEHQVVVCNNERMAYLYPLKEGLQKQLILNMKKDTRIDLIAWKENRTIRVIEGGSERELIFYPDGAYTDPYGRKWTLEGDFSVLDIETVPENDQFSHADKEIRINFGDFPDALSRLYGALFSQTCPMIVINARPRYEFESRYHPTHNKGGSHGSLHKWDSIIPLIVTGNDHVDQPFPSRLVELKEYILRLYD
jgi:hypothetical protein